MTPAEPRNEVAAAAASRRVRGVLAVLGLELLVILGVASAGYLLYADARRAAIATAEGTLRAIADLKAEEIAVWLDERRNNARMLAADLLLDGPLESWFLEGAPADARAVRFRAAMQVLQDGGQFMAVLLHDQEGKLRLAVGTVRPAEDREDAAGVDAALGARQATVSDIHFGSDGKLEMEIVVPLVVGSGQASRPIGAIHFRIDPNRYLYPLIQSWPTPSKTAETLLVRRDGEDVLLNP